MPNVPGYGEVPWDQYNYFQQTGDASHFSGPQPVVNEDGGASHSLAPNYAQILNQGTAYTGIGPSGQVGVGITAVPGGGIGGGGSTGGTDPYAQLLADNAAREAANDAATLAYRNAVLAGQRDDRALAAAQQAWAHTFAEKQQAFTEQQAQTATGMSMLGLQAQLRGPSNWFQYARTLGNTPGGVKDAVNALAGRYGLSSQQGSVPGSQYQRQTLGTLVGDVNGGVDGAADFSGAPLPSGSQWNSRNFGILAKNPTQIGLLQSLYDESGRDWNTELANYQSSLPKYSGARAARVQV